MTKISHQKRNFFSFLNNKDITDHEYKHAENVWSTFNLESIGEYHELYLKSDVLLLADIFETFRKT